VASVGRSARDATISLLGWPDHPTARHWEAEIRAWLAKVVRRHRSSRHLDDEMDYMFQVSCLDTAAHMLDATPPSTLSRFHRANQFRARRG
jgi:hypothetical protein